MKNINIREIEESFNDLIAELQNVKDLNSIASSYKENVDVLTKKLQEYYEHAKSHDASLKLILDKSVEQFSVQLANQQAVFSSIVDSIEGFEEEQNVVTNKIASDLSAQINNGISRITSGQKEVSEQQSLSFENILKEHTDISQKKTQEIQALEFAKVNKVVSDLSAQIDNRVNSIKNEQKEASEQQFLSFENALKEHTDSFYRSLNNFSGNLKSDYCEKTLKIERMIKHLDVEAKEHLDISQKKTQEIQAMEFAKVNDKVLELTKNISFLKISNIGLIIMILATLIICILK